MYISKHSGSQFSVHSSQFISLSDFLTFRLLDFLTLRPAPLLPRPSGTPSRGGHLFTSFFSALRSMLYALRSKLAFLFPALCALSPEPLLRLIASSLREAGISLSSLFFRTPRYNLRFAQPTRGAEGLRSMLYALRLPIRVIRFNPYNPCFP